MRIGDTHFYLRWADIRLSVFFCVYGFTHWGGDGHEFFGVIFNFSELNKTRHDGRLSYLVIRVEVWFLLDIEFNNFSENNLLFKGDERY